MFKRFIKLEWKAFTRASSFKVNLALKIFMILGAIYLIGIFLLMGIGAYYIIEEELHQDPLVVVSKFSIYYMVCDLLIRLFLQKIPVINIRPLLTLPIKRDTIVNFAIGKTMISFFNIVHLFFFVPFFVVLLSKDYDPLSATLWLLGMMMLVYCNNFLNILLNNKDGLFIIFIGLLIAMGALQYYGLFDITAYTTGFYHGFYATSYMVAVPLVLLVALWVVTFRYFRKNLYLDTGLKGRHDVAKTEDYTWLNQFGTMGTFLKNDIKLIRRNKRSKTTLLISVMFLFYGLMFMGGIDMYDNAIMKMFAGIFVSGGFLFTFGQFVPSWDSAYYPLMMSQNIQYREYIASKWWLVVIGTVVSTLLASFYLYFGIDTYLIILSGAVFNIGVNSHLVLLGGAYIKTPIDLASSKQAFGDKKAFNLKTFLISLPKMLVPMALFGIGTSVHSAGLGYGLVAGAGILGFAFRNKVFALIEKIYKTEKYDTVAAYKEKS
jgi:hypothetical protein